MPLVPIDSIDDRRLEPYRNLKFTSEMQRRGLFVAEGDKLVERLLRSRFQVHSVLAGRQFAASKRLEIPSDVTTFIAPDAMLRELVGFKFHRGVLACGVRGPARSTSALLDELPLTPREAIVVCIDIQDPTNLGTILRTAEAFGVSAVVLGGDCADPFSRRVLRVSMGSPFHLPLARSDDLRRDLESLRVRRHLTLIAAVASAAAESLDRVEPPDRLALLLGNESSGLTTKWVERCDRRVTIPMNPRADSLNVAVATGILLFHLCRSANA